KNLLSNAFKFTERGRVSISMVPAISGWNPENKLLNNADSVVAFSVKDTGIGIAPDKHRLIFEAFQQADGTITRKSGGPGPVLSSSREIAALLGGEIQLDSVVGEGSTFTLYLPASYTPESKRRRPHASAQIETMALPAREVEPEPLIMENVVDDDRAN